MSTSADHRQRPASAGFTLLEIMVTVAIVGLCILPMLEVREQASRMAYKSGHMLHALTYGNRILATRMLDPDTVKDEAGIIEEDPDFGYLLTVEDYDLSTGRVVEEEDEFGFSQTTNFSTTSAFTSGVPQDSAPGPDDVAAEDTQHRVRRLKLTMTWTALEGEQREELLLEGFLPRVEEPNDEGLLPKTPTPSAPTGAGK